MYQVEGVALCIGDFRDRTEVHSAPRPRGAGAPLPVGSTTHPWVRAADRSPVAQATRLSHGMYLQIFSTRPTDAKYAQVQSMLHNSSERAIRCVSRCSAAELDLIRNNLACDTC